MNKVSDYVQLKTRNPGEIFQKVLNYYPRYTRDQVFYKWKHLPLLEQIKKIWSNYEQSSRNVDFLIFLDLAKIIRFDFRKFQKDQLNVQTRTCSVQDVVDNLQLQIDAFDKGIDEDLVDILDI